MYGQVVTKTKKPTRTTSMERSHPAACAWLERSTEAGMHLSRKKHIKSNETAVAVRRANPSNSLSGAPGSYSTLAAAALVLSVRATVWSRQLDYACYPLLVHADASVRLGLMLLHDSL